MQTRTPGSAVGWERWVGCIPIGYMEIIAFINSNMVLSVLKC